MLIAQVTDVHLGFDPDNPSEFNRKRFDQVLRCLSAMNPAPDLLIMTGDLTDRGDAQAYHRLLSALEPCTIPVVAIPGNHDDRRHFCTAFPDTPLADGHVMYALERDGLRIILIDTLQQGRHGGGFCEARAAWLTAALDEAPDMPTLIAMHHPPCETGIEWMTTRQNEPWVERFAACVVGRTNIRAIICGHVHRAAMINWRGIPVAIASSCAPQVALEFAPINPDLPDYRPMIVADPPAYALHYWNGESLITHFENADDHVLLARYDRALKPLVGKLISERP